MLLSPRATSQRGQLGPNADPSTQRMPVAARHSFRKKNGVPWSVSRTYPV